MQRVVILVLGGIIIINDVIITKPLLEADRKVLYQIGFDYLCEAQIEDFRDWMTTAGLNLIEIEDITTLVEPVWQK